MSSDVYFLFLWYLKFYLLKKDFYTLYFFLLQLAYIHLVELINVSIMLIIEVSDIIVVIIFILYFMH